MAADLPPIAGVDIDGVLADPTHRLHHLERRPKHWRGFFADAAADPPLDRGVAAVMELAAAGLEICYVSGRPARLRHDTADWLHRNGLPTGALRLRPNRDFRPAPVFKVDVYRRLAEQHTIVTILDDDSAVVAALQRAGLPAVLADWYAPPAPERRALSDAQDERGRT